ncbi:MAG: tetratricopeptide repeat protein, partial [Cyclobacteriaceae bacterium]
MMRRKYLPLAVTGLLLCGFSCFAQSPRIDSLKVELERSTEDRKRLEILSELTANCTELVSDSAFFYGHQALSLSRKLGDPKIEARTLYDVGVMFKCRSNYDSALLYLHNGLGIPENRHEGSIYTVLASVYYTLGNVPLATLYYRQAIDFYTKVGDEFRLTYALTNMGYMYYQQGELQEAKKHQLEAAKLKIALGKFEILDFTYAYLGQIYFDLGKYDSAKWYYERGLELTEKYNSRGMRGLILTAMSDLQAADGNLQEALKNLKEAKEIRLETRDRVYLSITTNKIGEIYLAMNSIPAAINAFKESLGYALEVKNHQATLDAAKNLSDTYRRLGQLNFAFDYAEIYHASKDSLFNAENTKRLTLLDAELKFDKEKQVLELERQNEEIKLKSQIAKQRFIWITSLVGLLATIIIAYMLFRQNKIKTRSNEDLRKVNKIIQEQSNELEESSKKEKELFNQQIELKDRELALLAMQSNEKNNVLTRIDNALISNGSTPNLKELQKLVQANLKEDDSWNSFLNRFDQVYPGFFEKIKRDFHDLTLNQLKMSAYIKVGMDNRDIAQVTNVELESV